MAAAGTLEQLNVKFQKLWGSINEPEVLGKMVDFLKAAAAVKRLKGMTFGNFGGRPLGMYTAVANLEQWQKEFGIDVENVEQDDIIRAGETVDGGKGGACLWRGWNPMWGALRMTASA